MQSKSRQTRRHKAGRIMRNGILAFLWRMAGVLIAVIMLALTIAALVLPLYLAIAFNQWLWLLLYCFSIPFIGGVWAAWDGDEIT